MEHEHFFAIVAIVVALLSSSGALLFFVRYGTRMSLQEAASQQHEDAIKELTELNVSTRLHSLEEAVKEIKADLAKLNQLPVMSERLEYICRAMEKVMPKSEIEVRFELQDQKIANHTHQPLQN